MSLGSRYGCPWQFYRAAPAAGDEDEEERPGMTSKITATIRAGTERAETWRRIFGGDTVPLKSSIPTIEHLPGIGFAPVLYVNVDALSQDQLTALALHASIKFGEPLERVCADLSTRGAPVLADDLVVVITESADKEPS